MNCRIETTPDAKGAIAQVHLLSPENRLLACLTRYGKEWELSFYPAADYNTDPDQPDVHFTFSRHKKHVDLSEA